MVVVESRDRGEGVAPLTIVDGENILEGREGVPLAREASRLIVVEPDWDTQGKRLIARSRWSEAVQDNLF